MNKIFSAAVNFFKKETVLCAAWLLAIVSCFAVRPDREYLSYVDLRTLGILWSLMIIMQGLRKNGVFDRMSGFLLGRTDRIWKLAAVLVGLCFFSSMFITNDVSLITFVPFAVMILESAEKTELLIPVIVLQTLAANLGSMLTPIGNPQNLYLYGISGMSVTEFMGVMLPYSLLSLVMLIIGLLLIPGKAAPVKPPEPEATGKKAAGKGRTAVYAILFILSLTTVFRVVPYYITAGLVLISVLIIDRKLILRADYALLLTFVGFFIFTGNIHRIPALSDAVSNMLRGNEVIFSAAASQVISNVPAALLLADFTDNLRGLLIGVNIGGLGTLIASMASLISYKAYAGVKGAKKGRYMLIFTAANVIFLAAELLLALILGEL